MGEDRASEAAMSEPGTPPTRPRLPARLREAAREFVHGMTGYEFAQHAVQTRASLETMFMTVTLGDMLGVPVLPPYYALRLLPFAVPEVAAWKRRVLREKVFGESHEYDLHGV
jgi:hypothetical protein